eukprot:CAMPEP_0173354136 /NCGR_PEP_ID=MMETSP1144-20121109/17012_1 /TAXON_ID=483371 /ORGANISM="non described non described, Strain CCMP2298" /LENGTH=106 /DNA_ID=CAMNT_0014302641 /DNA_START=12 /DNA_END=332 /DNA_ORIENTATION=-
MAPITSIAEGTSSSGDSPTEDERLRRRGAPPNEPTGPPPLTKLLFIAGSWDSEVVVAVIPFTEFVSAVKVIVRTLNLTFSPISITKSFPSYFQVHNLLRLSYSQGA